MISTSCFNGLTGYNHEFVFSGTHTKSRLQVYYDGRDRHARMDWSQTNFSGKYVNVHTQPTVMSREHVEESTLGNGSSMTIHTIQNNTFKD